ncbi:hypothetical protein BX616_002834 [Lobosporangium transversale]|nr:hypothetical protein BX616_002834 [Lobosporangium transversale]
MSHSAGQHQHDKNHVKTAASDHSTTLNEAEATVKKDHNSSISNKGVKISPALACAVRVCIRSYGVGFVFATAPKLIRTLITFILSPRKATPKGQNFIAAFLKTIWAVLKDGASPRKDGMSMLLMISLGGYKLLEVFLNHGMKKVILTQHLQQQQQKQQQSQQWSRGDTSKVELPADLRQRTTMMASFLASAAAIIFMHKRRPGYATIDYTLFAVVRALDVFGHVAVKNRWGPSWLGSYGAVAVFVLACTEIMFSWIYEPERLPGPYAFWITKMSRMDKRLLETLRAVRAGTAQFGQSNPPEVSGLLTSLCEDLGMDPKMGKGYEKLGFGVV